MSKIANKLIRENYNITDEEWQRAEDYIIKQGRPVSEEELFKIVITCKVEFANYENHKIFFPDVKYELNDSVVILKKNGEIEYGKVVRIEPAHNHDIYTRNGTMILPYCEKLYVQPVKVKGDWESRRGLDCLISASKDYLAQKLSFLTREEVVDKFINSENKNAIGGGIIKQLQEEGRVISDGEKYFVRTHVPDISHKDLVSIFEFVDSSLAPVNIDDILVNVLNISLATSEIEFWRFSVRHALDKDKRFMRSGVDAWVLSPPPRETVITLDEEALLSGLIKITNTLNHILTYCHLSGTIKFLTYGCYEVYGSIEGKRDYIYGEGIRNWYLENDLKPNDQIHIRYPDQHNESLRLYTNFEAKKPSTSNEHSDRQRLHIRRLICEFLTNSNCYSSITEIGEGIAKSRNLHIEKPNIKAVLSNNPHLFETISPSCDLWGFRIWNIEDRVKHINVTGLLLAIQEDDLVYKVIEATEEPILGREIAVKIAEIFCLKTEQILSLSFLDPQDKRIIKLRNDRWTLKKSFDEWQKTLSEIENKLSYHERLKEDLNQIIKKSEVLKTDIKNLKDKINKLRNQIYKEKNEIKDIVGKIENLDREIKNLQSASKTIKRIPKTKRKANIIYYTTLFILFLASLVILLFEVKNGNRPVYIIPILLLCLALTLFLIIKIINQNWMRYKKAILLARRKSIDSMRKSFVKEVQQQQSKIDSLAQEVIVLEKEYNKKEKIVTVNEQEIKRIELCLTPDDIDKLLEEKKILCAKMGLV